MNPVVLSCDLTLESSQSTPKGSDSIGLEVKPEFASQVVLICSPSGEPPNPSPVVCQCHNLEACQGQAVHGMGSKLHGLK